jgi:hypothetical protein
VRQRARPISKGGHLEIATYPLSAFEPEATRYWATGGVGIILQPSLSGGEGGERSEPGEVSVTAQRRVTSSYLLRKLSLSTFGRAGALTLILPGTGRGTIRRMVERQARSAGPGPHLPLRQLRWSPSPRWGRIQSGVTISGIPPSGRSVTRPTGSGFCPGVSANLRASSQSANTVSASTIANRAPTQTRGPAPKGRYW